MNNVFSLRHHSSITQMSLSMPKKLRGQLYRLFISYEEGKESFLLRAVRDYEVFHGDIRGCEGYFDNAFSLNLFFEKEKPERILDLIELFASYLATCKWDDILGSFENDINIMFAGSDYNFRLNNCEIEPNAISFPKVHGDEKISKLILDIENNLKNKNYQLVVDRLHTYCGIYFTKIFAKYSLDVETDLNGHIDINKSCKKLAQYYNENGDFTNFSIEAIKKIGNLFCQYNSIRNDDSYAHPNELIEYAEAEFVVKIVCDILNFIENIEKA